MNFPNGIFTHDTYQSWHFTYNIMDKASPQKICFQVINFYFYLFLNIQYRFYITPLRGLLP